MQEELKMRKMTALALNGMGRIAWVAIALVPLMAAPAAQAGPLHAVEEAARLRHAAEEAAKLGHAPEEVARLGEAQANALKIESNVGGLEAKGVSVEANVAKIETGGGSGGGGDDPPAWFYVLCFVGAGVWLLAKIGARHRKTAKGAL
jgi:hypothetical protein